MKRREFIEKVVEGLERVVREEPRKGKLPKVIEADRKRSKDHFRKIAEQAWDEFQRRPRLQGIHLVAYKSHPSFIGGHIVIKIDRSGQVIETTAAGFYGAVWEI